ncbi:glyoxalase [Streptomyces sp. H27-G5]|uniref:glyoxalase n=1 Tax=Streptomyces sp. H27-G5 TaxID=2996698 RepID=UPI002270D211|nr:glyoxalase [Streptomyces sp. H27-G5]MCY0924233.1 glyoxalase [Streptomyces sp. H27-G5]
MIENVMPNETTIPLMPCASVPETLEFYRCLGFEVVHEQTRPYVYLALSYRGFQVHFGKAPAHLDPAREDGGGCLVLVDEVAPYHAAFTAAMRATHGKVLGSGRPRITRYRAGASRFTLIDPSGNSLIFIQRDEPATLEYGGSKSLRGLARAVDNARVLIEFKNDDHLAHRVLTTGLARHGENADDLDTAKALAMLIEIATTLGRPEEAAPWRERLARIPLDPDQRYQVEAMLRSTEHAAPLDRPEPVQEPVEEEAGS